MPTILPIKLLGTRDQNEDKAGNTGTKAVFLGNYFIGNKGTLPTP